MSCSSAGAFEVANTFPLDSNNSTSKKLEDFFCFPVGGTIAQVFLYLS